MLSLKYKDIKTRFHFYKNEMHKKALKYFFVSSVNQKNIKLSTKKKLVRFYLLKSNCGHSKTKMQRRCILTNRSKVSHGDFSISRIKLREMLKYNIIPGYKKAVW